MLFEQQKSVILPPKKTKLPWNKLAGCYGTAPSCHGNALLHAKQLIAAVRGPPTNVTKTSHIGKKEVNLECNQLLQIQLKGTTLHYPNFIMADILALPIFCEGASHDYMGIWGK